MGGTSATGGQGGVFGTVIGALIITVLIDLQLKRRIVKTN
jgi:ribose/xylose/arabinose/galactoside ABC-type transport system permease subunit